MPEAPEPFWPKPNGKLPKPPKVHAALGNRTFEQYARLSHAERLQVDAASAKGLTYEQADDPKTGKPYWKGKRLKS